MDTVWGVPPVSAPRIMLPARYRVVRHLANGGMASVWEAHDDLLERRVAVKVLASHLNEDERARRRFQREARAVAGLSSHPYVVTIYDVGEHDGRSFIVMELLSGGSVADRRRGGQRVPGALALRWLGEAASALDAAHEAGIVHRDVKPGNMLLDERERLALGDFGIARVAWEDQLTQTGQVLGTAAYISPEQAMGDPATPASDRYGLAVVAYELLTGRRPFAAEHFTAQARAHVEDDAPAASDVDPSLPAAVDDVLWRGLAKQPQERWPTAAAFVDALEDALAPRRRRVAPGALAALAALVLVAAAAAFLLVNRDTGNPPAARATATATATATAQAQRTAQATPTATATRTATATPTATATATTTAPAAATPTATASPAAPASSSAAELQRQAFELNNAGKPEQALPLAARSVQLCAGSDQVSPCAYALFEYARALRLTGNPQKAIDVLQERKRRFPHDQPRAVAKELAAARKAARG